jgi:hypothetical protein
VGDGKGHLPSRSGSAEYFFGFSQSRAGCSDVIQQDDISVRHSVFVFDRECSQYVFKSFCSVFYPRLMLRVFGFE